MKNNSIDMKSVLVTMSNIVSLCSSLKEQGEMDDKTLVETFNTHVKTLKETLDDEINWENMSAEDWTALGAMCKDPQKYYYLLPPHIIKFLPDDFELSVMETDGKKTYIKVRDISFDDIWEVNDFGLTKFGVFATQEGQFDTLINLTFGKAFDILRNPENIDRIMRLPKWQSDVYIRVKWPEGESDNEMTHPYLYVTSRYGSVPWKETIPELFSSDWEVYDIDIYMAEVDKKKKEEFERLCKFKDNLENVNIKEVTKSLNFDIEGIGNVDEIKK